MTDKIVWNHFLILLSYIALAIMEIVLLIVALKLLARDVSRTKLEKFGWALEIVFFPLFGPLHYLFSPKKKDNVKM